MIFNTSNLNEYIWVNLQGEFDTEFSVPVGVRILQKLNNKILVIDDNDNEFWIQYKDILKPMHKFSQNYVSDMIKLGDLQEYFIIRNLHVRFKKKMIYTYIDLILVVMNPYEMLPIYDDHVIAEYRNKRINIVAPHIFGVAETALQEMRRNCTNQCIVISGESGAGKTESTKLIIQYFSAMNDHQTTVGKKIIDADLILEAFGNAKTLRNDNSSRFGKYINIFFTECGKQEARIQHYLLEKSRITSQYQGELNFHIFYTTLFGMPNNDKRKLELDCTTKYLYLNECSSYYGKNASRDFYNILTIMKLLLFKADDIWNIFKFLAVILHLGNLKIEKTSENIGSSNIADELNSKRISKLLGITMSALKSGLTKKTIFVQNERVSLNISRNAAVNVRDSFVKAIYEKLFLRIICDINRAISFEKNQTISSVGVLDFFGFENLYLNGFEQLCINYANESLQQFFVEHIFKSDQYEYLVEQISWQNIEFVDNMDVIDLICHKKLNKMAVNAEQCKILNGKDMIFTKKLKKTDDKNSIISCSKNTTSKLFKIKHYADNVHYNANRFLEKSKDIISLDIKEMVKQSENTCLVELFQPDMKNDRQKKRGAISLQFENSFNSLIKRLSLCRPFFVRCIKPNKMKQPHIFDNSLCVQQLRYLGILKTEIRKNRYPIQYVFCDFLDRYKILSYKKKPLTEMETVNLICEKYIPSASYQIGRTKVFLKNEDELLSSETQLIEMSTIKIQHFYRNVIFKCWLSKHRKAAILIQKNYRAHLYCSKYKIMTKGFYRLQATVRAKYLTQFFNKQKKSILDIQAYWRGYRCRKIYKFVYGERQMSINILKKIYFIEKENHKKKKTTNWKFIAQSNYNSYRTALHLAVYDALTGGGLDIEHKMYQEYAKIRSSNPFVLLLP